MRENAFFAKSHIGRCSSSVRPVIIIPSSLSEKIHGCLIQANEVFGQLVPKSTCTDAQADQSLHCTEAVRSLYIEISRLTVVLSSSQSHILQSYISHI